MAKSLLLRLIYLLGSWHGAGDWQDEINGVLGFYIDAIKHPASDPDAFEPGEMDQPDAPAP